MAGPTEAPKITEVPSAEPVKREMTKAEAEETLDRLHYCKKHGSKMEEKDGAWHCPEDDKEKAAEEEKEAKAAFAIYSAKRGA